MPNFVHKITFTVLVIGGLNWLGFAFFDWELGQAFGGPGSLGGQIFYILVGASALFELVTHKNRCKECVGDDMPQRSSMPPQQQY